MKQMESKWLPEAWGEETFYQMHVSSHMPTQRTKIDIYICSKCAAALCEEESEAFLLLTAGEWMHSSGAGSKQIELIRTIASCMLL